MDVIVIDRDRRLPWAARENILHQIKAKLARFAPRIRRVSVVVSDKNGPRGGTDQHCRVAVRLRTWGEFIVDAMDTNLGRAVCHAADRMERVLVRSLERRRDKRDRNSPGGIVPLLSNGWAPRKEAVP